MFDVSVHIDTKEQHEGILDTQVENCPKCSSKLDEGFGMAGGGFGVYGYCPKCEKIIWKCQVEM
jgi:ssDNA-binding Zn-finger/Zn-ribbon topoisomerase 1